MQKIKEFFKQIFCKEADIFISNILHSPFAFEEKRNKWGGINYKYRVPKGVFVESLSDDGQTISISEVEYFSKHTNIPAFMVTYSHPERGINSIICSPENSIIIYDEDNNLKTVNLFEDNVLGKKMPCKSKRDHAIILRIEYLDCAIDMYDLTLIGDKIFLADNLLFVYDTVSVHVPIGREAVEEAKKMMLSYQLIDEPSGSLVAHPEHASSVGLYMLTKTPEGRDVVNKMLPENLRITEPLTKSGSKDIVTELFKQDRERAGVVVNELRKLGDMESFKRGVTTSLSDLEPYTDLRKEVIGNILADIRKVPKEEMTDDKLHSIYKTHIDRATDGINQRFKDSDSSLATFFKSKARGSISQFRDLVLGPISVQASEPVDVPIAHSYSEGLTPAEYFIAASGARKGVMGRAQATALPGALGKEVLATANNLVISKDRGNSMNVIDLSIKNNDDVLDRYIGKDVIVNNEVIIPKDTVVTSKTIQRAKNHGIETLPVYTPLQSSSADGGIPAYTYGLTAVGKLPEVGFNLGASSALGIVSPLFTESMESFHSGGSMQDKMKGYPRLKQILELTKEIPNKATLSTLDGKVDSIDKDEFGGFNVKINGENHYIKSPLKPMVEIGKSVTKGDQISEGFIDPKELAKHKGLLAAQNYMVDEIVKNVPSKIRRRAAEAVVESITRHCEITDPGDSHFFHGDIALISEVEKHNKESQTPIKYDYRFTGVNYLPQISQDWLSQLNFRNLNKTFDKAIQYGKEQNIHSYQPAASIAISNLFGKGEDGKY